MFGALERLGYDVESLLATAGLRRADVEDPDVTIPARVCAGILSAAYRSRRLKNLPLRLALEMPAGASPLLDYIVASSESVGEGLRRLGRYLCLVNPAISIEFQDQAEPHRVLVESPADPFGVELTVSLSLLRMRSETEGRLRAEEIRFRHEPEDAAEISRVLGCPVHTRSSWNGWAVSSDACRMRLRRRDPALRRWLEGNAARLLARQAPQERATDQVRTALASLLAGGDVRLEAVARRLALTPRTLQRRLAGEGTSYDDLRDAVRKEVAKELLADSRLSIAEVAYLLGYSEPAAFHRAFKRWYRAGPRAFRERSCASNAR